MDKWKVEFVKVKDGIVVAGSFWSCTVEEDGAVIAIQTATDKMIDSIPAGEGGYYRVFRATNESLMARKTAIPIKP